MTSVTVTPEMAEADAPLAVGLPKPGTRIRVVDAHGSDVPAGRHGEIVVEGDTVAKGYFGREDLTAKAFGVADLEGRPVRTYRTGDEGWLDAEGMLHYRGRLDLQVKLDGFRIELGDIEENLRRLDAVAYLRFASVYRHFQCMDDFLAEIAVLQDAGHEGPGTG